MSPVPDRPPRLLVGGGSDRLLGLAGRFADLLDLHGDPKHGRVAGATMAQASAGDVARRAHTTVDDLAGRIGLVRDAAEAAGRPRDAVGVATQIWYAAFGSPAEVRAAEEELCERWAGIPYRPLHRSPYLLFGSPAQMAEALAERREAYGLQRISLSEESGIAAAPPDPVRFCREVQCPWPSDRKRVQGSRERLGRIGAVRPDARGRTGSSCRHDSLRCGTGAASTSGTGCRALAGGAAECMPTTRLPVPPSGHFPDREPARNARKRRGDVDRGVSLCAGTRRWRRWNRRA